MSYDVFFFFFGTDVVFFVPVFTVFGLAFDEPVLLTVLFLFCPFSGAIVFSLLVFAVFGFDLDEPVSLTALFLFLGALPLSLLTTSRTR